MDDDTQTSARIKIPFRGEELEARPLPHEHIIMVGAIRKNGNLIRSFSTITRIIEKSIGQDQWDPIYDLWVDQEITMTDISELIVSLIQATAEHIKATAKSA